MTRLSVVLALLALGAARPAVVAAADVHIGIDVGGPPPPVVAFPAPPQFAVVPGVPIVQYAPQVTFNLFSYGGQYFTFQNGAWFWARNYGEPWVYVPRARMPHPVLAVPVRYYRVPPGQAKKWYGHGKHRGRGHWGHGHGERGRGHGHED